jgi:hypothetical protein
LIPFWLYFIYFSFELKLLASFAFPLSSAIPLSSFAIPLRHQLAFHIDGYD